MARPTTTTPPNKKQKLHHGVLNIVDEPIGDMLIQVGAGADAGLVRVCKAFLIIASPVFKAMLPGSFSEGSRTFGENDPLVLEDDDRSAFIDFCKIVHHQGIHDRGKVNIDRAVALAVLVDKYGCRGDIIQPLLNPLRVMSDTGAMKEMKERVSSSQDLLTLVLLAYLADDRDLLWQTSRYAVIEVDATGLEKGADPSLQLIAPKVITTLARLRKILLVDLEKGCGTGVAQFSKKGYSDVAKMGRIAVFNIGLYHVALAKLKGDSLGDLSTSEKSLSAIWSAFARLADKSTQAVVQCACKRCGGSDQKVLAELVTNIEKSRRNARGLCIQCGLGENVSLAESCKHFKAATTG